MTTTTPVIDARKRQQGYDPDPPRCCTCVYFTRGTNSERTILKKKGIDPSAAERCVFGDFRTTPSALCDEWRNRAGDRLQKPDDEVADA